MSELEAAACEFLSQNQPIIIATIISRQGSAPRTAGTKMLITRQGQIYGTIGGGLLEASTIKSAMDIFSGAPPMFIPFDLAHQASETMDMICGGSAEILLDLVEPDRENLDIFTQWEHALQNGQTCYLVTIVKGGTKHIDQITRCLVYNDCSMIGSLPAGALSAGEIINRAQSSSGMFVISHDEITMITEPSVKPKTVYIFGAGHVARPVAHMASIVDFRVSVLDDRTEFANAERFPDADEVCVIDDFDKALKDLPIDKDAFIVILTRGHKHDKTVLVQALQTEADYIGMIGSRRKRDLIYQSILEQGFTKEDLNRVHAPIGLSIDAETPEEIAVSIVGELVQKRARMRQNST
ncbi:MAG: XdhC family protein [Desulfobacteraceae bacterium]|nr:XdhC family protein [Desulfobacteraceae bacterium]